jgi:cytochrome c556
MSDDHLNAMALATQTLGSCLMAAHFMQQPAQERQAKVKDYVDAYFCEEDFHVELLGIAHNGPDPMQDKKRQAMTKDLEDSAAYLALIEQG